MMPDSLVRIITVVAMLLLLGIGLGQFRRSEFSVRWLLVAAGLIFVNDAALTNGFSILPDLFSESSWNWQGKILALIMTLAIVAHPAFGWRRSGFILAQRAEGRKTTYAVTLILCLLFAGLAASTANDDPNREALAFQLTMPGVEEEPFYRGVLLLALNEAYRGRKKVLGIALGWGGLLSSFLFGLVHAFDYSEGAFSFDLTAMLVTALPSLILVWLRERTGSLVVPILLHNFANSIFRIL